MTMLQQQQMMIMMVMVMVMLMLIAMATTAITIVHLITNSEHLLSSDQQAERFNLLASSS